MTPLRVVQHTARSDDPIACALSNSPAFSVRFRAAIAERALPTTKGKSSTKSVRRRRKALSRVDKKANDLVLYLVACVTAGTGLLLAYRLPHGAGKASRVVFFGFGRHEWGDIHTWLAYLAIFLVVVHLALNWQWLVKRIA